MFVSSYNTYIDTTATKRVSEGRRESDKKPSESFSAKLLQTTPSKLSLEKQLPLNYISSYKALHTKQQLQEQSLALKSETQKFTKLSSISGAKVAYSDNSNMFSLIQKPKATLEQTPKIPKYLPKEAQGKQEEVLKIKMVNAYIANDNYFHITAA